MGVGVDFTAINRTYQRSHGACNCVSSWSSASGACVVSCHPCSACVILTCALLLLTLVLWQVQDTVAVCATQLSQQIALASLQHGSSYIQQQIAALHTNQEAIENALSPLGSAGHGWVGGEGAIYYWAKLPEAPSTLAGDGAAGAQAAGAVDGGDAAAAAALAAGDEAVVEWLIQEHGVCIIPGSACGAPGYVRVAFANLKPEQCMVAAGRLKAGLEQLVGVAAGGESNAEAQAPSSVQVAA